MAMAVKLVIVDDAPFIREVIRHALTDENVQIVGEARDGVEAVEVVLRTRPDLVFMDLVMPRMSGIEAAREISEQLPETRIVACSTLDQEAMVMKALEAGCSHYIVKPFKKEDLLRALELVTR